MYLGTVARVGMTAHPLRCAAARLLLDGFKHAAEVARIIAGARHDLCAEQIRLLLVFPAVLHQPGSKSELTSLRDHVTPAAADHGAGDGAGDLAELKSLRLGGIRGPMSEQHVTQFVRHHADDFAFTLGGLEHSAIDEHRSAWQGERVDVLQVDRRERVLEDGVVEIGGRCRNEPLTEPIQVAGNRCILYQWILPAHLLSCFPPELNILFGRVLVPGRRHLRLCRRVDAHQDENGQQAEDRSPLFRSSYVTRAPSSSRCPGGWRQRRLRLRLRLRRRTPHHSSESEQRQSERAARHYTTPSRRRRVGVQKLSIGVDLLAALQLFPALERLTPIDRIGWSGRSGVRLGRHRVGRCDPTGHECERFRAADRAVLLVVDLFTIQAEPSIYKTHESPMCLYLTAFHGQIATNAVAGGPGGWAGSGGKEAIARAGTKPAAYGAGLEAGVPASRTMRSNGAMRYRSSTPTAMTPSCHLIFFPSFLVLGV